MAKIKDLKAREILDSQGNPTVEVSVILSDGIVAKASTPSGYMAEKYEAIELRDRNEKRYGGKGVLRAVKNINTEIKELLKDRVASDQEKIDREMMELDGGEKKDRLGVNAIYPVSLAIARAEAVSEGLELFEYLAKTFNFKKKDFKIPIPFLNIFNGGRYADTNLDFQEFMIVPSAVSTFAENLRMGAEIFHELAHILRDAGFDTDVGNEGGYAPDIDSSIQAIELILSAALEAGYKPGEDFGLAIDVAASELYDSVSGKYIFKLDHASYVSDTLVGLYNEWLRKYPIVAIEDGLGDEDWQSWRQLNLELGADMLLVGDKLFSTNIKRLRMGLKEKAANSMLIKPNQAGTLSETIECIKLAQKHNYKIIISARCSETCDDFISDLAVATGAEYIKAGSLNRSERLSKYNRLMEIEEYLK